MSKSIIQDKRRGECYLCNMLLGIDTPAPIREEHHVMHGTANRKLSEHYGLKVYLCPYHHRNGPQAAHRCRQTDILLKQAAQRAFERKYSPGKWMEVFGKNYLEAAGQEPGAAPPGSSREAAGDIQEAAGSSQTAAGQKPAEKRTGAAAGGQAAATCKNQQNKPFSQINISQNTPSGFCFLKQDPGKEEL